MFKQNPSILEEWWFQGNWTGVPLLHHRHSRPPTNIAGLPGDDPCPGIGRGTAEVGLPSSPGLGL